MCDLRLLRLAEVASVLGVSRSTAYALAKSGRLPSIRVGPGCVRVDVRDLERFLEERRVGGGER